MPDDFDPGTFPPGTTCTVEASVVLDLLRGVRDILHDPRVARLLPGDRVSLSVTATTLTSCYLWLVALGTEGTPDPNDPIPNPTQVLQKWVEERLAYRDDVQNRIYMVPETTPGTRVAPKPEDRVTVTAGAKLQRHVDYRTGERTEEEADFRAPGSVKVFQACRACRHEPVRAPAEDLCQSCYEAPKAIRPGCRACGDPIESDEPGASLCPNCEHLIHGSRP